MVFAGRNYFCRLPASIIHRWEVFYQMRELLLPALMLAAFPRPEFLYVLGRSLAHGPRAGRLASLGVALALCVHTIFIVCGLPILLITPLPIFHNLRLAGAAYMGWAGLQMLLPARKHSGKPPWSPDSPSIVFQALLCNLLDARASLYSVFFLMQWMSPGDSNIVFAVKAILSGSIMAAAFFGWFSLISLAGTRLGLAIRRNPAFEVDLDHAMGLLMLILAVMLALQSS